MIKQFGCLRLTILALSFSVAALADITNQNATLAVGAGLNMDNGTAASSGGDILFTGTSITVQTGATIGAIPGSGGASVYGAFTSQQALSSLASLLGQSPLTGSGIAANSVFIVHTHGGNYAKALITAVSASSLTIEYTTYGGSASGGGAAAPTIADIQNNSSLVPAGFPNAGIAPSTIFVVHGANMATPGTVPVLQTIGPSGGTLPLTLNGTSLTVVVNGTTVHPAFYYSSPSQLAAELPANTPVGTGTLTVSYGGASANTPITVVPSAFGIDIYNGNTGVLQDSVSGAIITPTNSAKPGEAVTLWGTGLGADAGDSDVNYSNSPQKITTQTQVYLGLVQVPAANILYTGSLGYPGVNGIVFNVPANVPSGCYVSIAVVTGGVVSNVATGSFMPNGGVCSDAYTGLTGTTISTLAGQSTVRFGSVIVGQTTSPGLNGGSPTTTDVALASFQQVSGTSSVSNGSISAESCSLNQALQLGGAVPVVTGLNAGTVTVTPPSGSAIAMQSIPLVPGEYLAQLASNAIPASGGTFAFSGTGGSAAPAVGAFSTTVNFPNPLLSWTNQGASATVARTSGQTFTWTGGAPGSYVVINGFALSGNLGITGSYTCIAPVSDGQFQVPPFITLGLPSGTGTTSLENSTAFNTFAASGIDYGYGIGFLETSVNTTWQ
jgi:uncharacterized protein (TIGR03437 family)